MHTLLTQYKNRSMVWAVFGWLVLACAGCGSNTSDSAPQTRSPKAGSTGWGGSSAKGRMETSRASATGGNGAAPSGSVDMAASTGGGHGTECQRVVEFTAVKLAEPPPFDLIIVADNSDSLAWSRDDLARGLSTLLADVGGRQVKVFVLTPTQYGASTEAGAPWLTAMSEISWKDPVTNVFYPNAITEYHLDCSDAAGAAITCPDGPDNAAAVMTVKGTWQFLMPKPVAVLTPTLSESELEEQQAAVSKAILELGGGGSQVEQPLCTLNRYILQDAPQLPKHAVFLVISDEDDNSSARNCLKSHTIAVTATGELRSCSSNCDEYRYSMTGPICGRILEFNCVPVDDVGTLYPDEAQPHTMIKYECDSNPRATCTAEQLEATKRYCPPGTISRDCVARSSETKDEYCFVTRSDPNTDLCTTAFTHAGTYANLADYCTKIYGASSWANCKLEGYKRVPRPGSASMNASFEPLVVGASTADLIRSFHTKASVAFRDGGHKVQAIVFDPDFSCPLKAGQSYATNLAAIANTPNDVFPICEPYSQALSEIKGFASSLLASEYSLQLASDEVVESVQVTDRRGGSRKLQVKEFTFDRSTSTLILARGVLTSNDVDLSVEIVANCRPKLF